MRDTDTSIPPNPLLTRSDNYNGLQEAAYTNTGKLTSVVFLNAGLWQVYLGNQTLRTIWLTLSRPANGSAPAPAPDGYYSANVEVYSRCYDVNNQETGWFGIPPSGVNNRCSLGVDFSYGRTKYKLVMGPTYPVTGWATVSCNAAGDSACASWSVNPNLNAGNGNVPTVANLYEFTNRGLVFIRSYYNTYRIDVTNH